MAVYKIDKEHREASSITKKVGIALLVMCTLCYVALFTNLIIFLKSFLLGCFGLFSYPLFLTLFFVGLALINNRKYIMSPKYLIFILFSIISLLSIVQLLLINNTGLSFGEYLLKCYTKQITAGGIIVGLFVAPILYILNSTGAYIIFSISSIVFIALTIDYIYYSKDQAKITKPMEILNKIESKSENKVEVVKPKINTNENEKTNIVLGANIENKKKSRLFDNFEQTPKTQTTIPYDETKMSRKQYLLSTPDIADLMAQNKKEIDKNLQKIKQETAIPKPISKDDLLKRDTASFERFVNDNKSKEDNIISEKEELPSNINNASSNSQHTLADKIMQDIMNNDNDLNANPIAPIKEERRGYRQLNIEDSTPKIEEKNTEKEVYVYKRPPLSLLTTESMDLSIFKENLVEKREQLESALETFGVPAKVIDIIVGPAVTRYELEMPPGISVKKITGHADDIALVLASNGDIRIEAPIPGKSAVGIEVPNSKIATVGFKDIISSTEFQNHRSPLVMALGKDINGMVRLCNLKNMPHLIVAGSTGSGKSVCLNSIIMSILYKTSPEDVKFILIDPKRVEFSMYNGMPHLLTPEVVTEPDNSLNAFNWAIDEMERRYILFQQYRAKNIDEYNNSPKVLDGTFEKLKYIILIVDELADLMMTTKREIEDKIMRLAQKARAAGIHLILATQRPSVDVITGSIKNNFPSRIAFAVTSFADSKTVLDQSGAEKLLGRGDMLYAPNDAAEPKRVQGCYLSTEEIDNVVKFIKENNKCIFDENATEAINHIKKTSDDNRMDKMNSFDPLVRDVLKYFIESGQASITMIQRRFVVGFPRASRIIDQMERANFISPSEGSKPRSVYVTLEQYEELFGKE